MGGYDGWDPRSGSPPPGGWSAHVDDPHFSKHIQDRDYDDRSAAVHAARERMTMKNELDRPGTDTEDTDPSNVIFRAGYLRGLAAKLEGDEREYVLRASRSLEAFHRSLIKKPA